MPSVTKIAFYGGSFDPVHRGHLAIGETLISLFKLDEFVFIPAFHAPHKKRLEPTSAYDRYAMLCLATNAESNISVSKIEIEAPSRPYTVETLSRLKDLLPEAELFFVMGADSWRDIRTWREWERVLTMTNQIVVSRPGYKLTSDHVTEEIREQIVDLQGGKPPELDADSGRSKIYFTDAVNIDISSTAIRQQWHDRGDDRKDGLTREVANYIEKYQIYT